MQVTQHLAAVTDAECERILPGKERGEFSAGFLVEEDALGPAFTCSQNIAVTETTAGGQAAKVIQ